MRRHMRIGFAWLGATALSVLIASAAVAGIRDRVVETPVAIGLPTTTTTTTTTFAPGAVPDTAPAGPATTAPSETTSTTTTAATTKAPPTTTTTLIESTVSTTTQPPATTTTAPPVTTTTALPLTTETYTLIGGTVTLSFGNGDVNLVSAVPRPGFDTDYEHTGPKEVEVKFESDSHKSKLEAHWDSGELKVDIEEEPRSGHDSHDS